MKMGQILAYFSSCISSVAREAGWSGAPAETRKNLRVENLPDETIQSLRDVRMDPRHEHLNALMRE